VQELEVGTKDAAIIGALVALGAGLGLRVVAEGVETQHVRKILQRLGCWAMQGYLFSRPVGADELSALLRRQQQGHGLGLGLAAAQAVALV
jgi:diguanylate cyclase